MHTTRMRVLVVFLAATVCRAEPQPVSLSQRQQNIRHTMCRVGDWMLAHRHETPGGRCRDSHWTVGTWYAGVYALYDLTRETRYLDPLLAMEKSTGWRVGPAPLFADDQCIAQTYLDLFRHVRQDAVLIAHVRGVCDAMMSYPCDQTMEKHMQVCYKGEWSWCDALFMAPPVWSRMAQVTGEMKYLDFMDRKWQKTKTFLYDQEERLYFRDASFFDKREANGSKVFWSRGNGWVLAGLARVLDDMPKTYPSRPQYEQQFVEMAQRIVACQPADGLWRASLLDPERFPVPETSGSGFFCYALAWGINNGILKRDVFESAALRTWSALVGCVNAEGKLTHVQPMGADPRNFEPDSTEIYGVGAFLLAGREVSRLPRGQPSD